MKYSKVQLAGMCVFAAIGIQVLGAAYAALTLVGTWQGMPYEGFSLAQVLGPSLIWTGALAVAGVIAVQKLKAEDVIGWVGTLAVLGFMLPSMAFVPALLGIVCLLDKSVRGKYLKELDIQF